MAEISDLLGVPAYRVSNGQEKAAVAHALGPGLCAAIGNGTNDAALLRSVAVGIAVLGAEGASTQALLAADVVCPSILTALDLVTDERALTATLRP
ncbi:MAG TPA: hypothetical protein VH561_00015 [Micromonosporaceae bacterium]|jgi:soluble P-type ATPase